MGENSSFEERIEKAKKEAAARKANMSQEELENLKLASRNHTRKIRSETERNFIVDVNKANDSATIDQSDIIFRVTCGGDDFLIKEAISKYNETYKTDFQILNFEELDGILFADIKVSDMKIHHVFDLGRSFGERLQYLRSNGNIDW